VVVVFAEQIRRLIGDGHGCGGDGIGQRLVVVRRG
jgi:hypothetical protein